MSLNVDKVGVRNRLHSRGNGENVSESVKPVITLRVTVRIIINVINVTFCQNLAQNVYQGNLNLGAFGTTIPPQRVGARKGCPVLITVTDDQAGCNREGQKEI